MDVQLTTNTLGHLEYASIEMNNGTYQIEHDLHGLFARDVVEPIKGELEHLVKVWQQHYTLNSFDKHF